MSDASQLVRRIAGTGLPTLVASGILYLQPLVGRTFLDGHQYATWALGATILTIGLTLDFGGAAYVAASSASGTLTKNALWRAIVLSASGSIAIGLLAMLIWPSYQSRHALALPGISGFTFFLLIGFASAFRSVTTILAALLMALGRYTQRASLLFGQAVFQSLTLLALLYNGAGLWALPTSSIAGSLILLPWLFKLPMLNAEVVNIGKIIPLRSFATWKVVAAVLSLAVTQMDRWVVGAIVSPGELAQYDVTARLAGLPRLVVIGIAGVLVAEAASLSTSEDISAVRRLYTRSLMIMGLILLGTSLLTFSVPVFIGNSLGNISFPLFSYLLVAYGAHALTAPGTMIMGGLGKPEYDFIHIVPVSLITCAMWTVAFQKNSDSLAVISAATGLLIWSPIFCGLVVTRLRAGAQHLKGTRT